MSVAPPSARLDARLWALNGGVFVLSFLASGLANAIPQLALWQLVPQQKAFWLALCLLAGTGCAILGTLAGGARWERVGSGRWELLAMAGTALGAWGLFTCRDARLFVALSAMLCGLTNLLITRFDHLATRAADPVRRALNDRLGTACRLLGMLLAPWFFTHLLHSPPALAVATAVALLASMAALTATGPGSSLPEPGEGSPARRIPLDAVDCLLVGHAVTVYAALYLFSSNLSYFLHDALRLEHATPRSGLLIVTVFLMALAVVALAQVLPRAERHPEPRPSLAALLPILPLLIAIGAYETRAVLTFQGMLAIAAGLGMGYGGFLLGLRDHVSRATQRGKAAMLTVYNNLANTSALLAYLALLVLARLVPGAGPAYYEGWLRLLAVVALSGVPLLLLARRRSEVPCLVRGEARP